MAEWLGRTRIDKELIEKDQPSLVNYFPMLTRYYVDNQKLHVNTTLDYDKGYQFMEMVRKVYGSVTPTTIRQAADDAIDRWMKDHS